jgi:hypothetical protein
MVPYLEVGSFSFTPIIPLHSNVGLERDLELGKSSPRTTHLRSQSRAWVQPSNGYPNMIPCLEAGNFAFPPIIPLRSNMGLERDPKLGKCDSRTTRLRSQSRPRVQPSNGYPNMIPYLEVGNFAFPPIIPICSNAGLERDLKLGKNSPRTKGLRSQIRPRVQPSNGYQNMFPYLESGNFAFRPIIPLCSNVGLEWDMELGKSSQELHVLARN